MNEAQLANAASSTRSHRPDADTVIVGDVARRLREANERAFRSTEKPWGRSWLSRLLGRDKPRE